jgi:hypothetical protein
MSSSGVLNPPMFGTSFASSPSVSTAVTRNSSSIGRRNALNKAEFRYSAPVNTYSKGLVTKNNSRSTSNNSYFLRDVNKGVAQSVKYH